MVSGWRFFQLDRGCKRLAVVHALIFCDAQLFFLGRATYYRKS